MKRPSKEELKAFWSRQNKVIESRAMKDLIDKEGYYGDFVDDVGCWVAKTPERTEAVLSGKLKLSRNHETEGEDIGGDMWDAEQHYENEEKK